ncbi:SMI1/KNR4 family protein [Streptomyces sp. NPDC048172]|uniref:SMI1/KNR4 family protein n=1 Tax=Streptomyces sp. NPDC048172 TaxID=3365505 RepID=UPI003721967D
MGTSRRAEILAEFRDQRTDRAWQSIEHWLATYAHAELPLPGPCSREDLERLHERVGVRLPREMERSLLRHNGSGTVAVFPNGFALLSVEDIIERYDMWIEFGREMREEWWVRGFDKTPNLYVPVAALGPTVMLVQTRNKSLGSWSPESSGGGEPWHQEWGTPLTVLDCVGKALDSEPPWTLTLPDDKKRKATHTDPARPGTLHWTDG